MSQVKGIAAQRVFPGSIGLYLKFFTEAEANCFYQRAIKKRSRVERIDRLSVVIKFSDAAKS